MSSNIQKISNNSATGVEIYKKSETMFFGETLSEEIKLTNSEMELIENINYSPILEMSFTEILEPAYNIIVQNLTAMGSKMHPDDRVVMANQLTEELANDFPDLTIKEVDTIIRNGIRGKYDTEKQVTIGLSIVNFNKWATKYNEIKLKLHQEILIKKNNLLLPEQASRPITKESTIDMLREQYKAQLSSYDSLDDREKLTQTFNDFWLEKGFFINSNYVCKQLLKFKLISKKAVELEIKESQKTKMEKSSIEYINFKIEAERIVCCKYVLKLIEEKKKSNGNTGTKKENCKSNFEKDPKG